MSARTIRLLALPLLLLALPACPALWSAIGVAAPIAADAIGAYETQLQRAQQLAPGLSPTRPSDAALLDEIVRRLDTLDACQANAAAAIAFDAGATDSTRTTSALIDAAAALRGLVDAIAKAQAAPLPSSVLPFASPIPFAPRDAGPDAPPDAGAKQGTP